MKPIYVKDGPKEFCGAEIIQALRKQAEKKEIIIKTVDESVTSPRADKLLSRVAIAFCLALVVIVLIGMVRAWVM